MKSILVNTIVFFFAYDAYAVAVKTGTPLCTGDQCGNRSLVDEVSQQQAKEVEHEEVTPIPSALSAVEKTGNRQQRSVRKKLASEIDSSSNLPSYYSSSDRDLEISNASRIIENYKETPVKLGDVQIGDVYSALIEQEIICSAATKAPVRALITSGKMRGSLLVGEASLDAELKRVLLNFNKIRPKGMDTVFDIKAVGLSRSGSIGIVGRYHTNSGKFFIAELLSAGTAGFVDATIPRSQNALGNYVQEISVQNSGKAAAISALSKTTERMADQVRKAPEYTQVDGYQEIRVLIQDTNNQ